MSLAMICNFCGHEYKLNDRFAARTVKCNQCGQAMQVPGIAVQASALAPAVAALLDEELAESSFSSGQALHPLGMGASSYARSRSSVSSVVWLLLGGGLVFMVMLGSVAFLVVRYVSGGAGAAIDGPRVVLQQAGAQTEFSPDATMSDTQAAFQSLADALVSVNDVASAQAAAPRLAPLAQQATALGERLDALKRSLSPADEKALQARHGAAVVAAMKRFYDQLERIENIPGAKQALASSLQSLFPRGNLHEGGAAPAAPSGLASQPGFGPAPNSAQSPLGAPPGFPPGFGGPASMPGPPNMDQFAQQMIQRYGADRVATIVVEGLPGDVAAWLYERIKTLTRCEAFSGSSNGQLLSAVVAPAGDLNELAASLDFGAVSKIDSAKRTLFVKADPKKLPEPLKPEVTNPRDPEFYRQNLADLDCFDAHRRRNAAGRLKDARPEQLRAEITKALEALLLDRDNGTRKEALVAYAVWAGAEGAVALVGAIADDDVFVREAGLEGLSRLDGELEKEAVIEALAALFPRDRMQATRWFKLIGAAAEPAVRKHLKHPDGWVRLDAVKLLGEIGTEESVAALKAASRTDDAFVPAAAREALEKIARRAKESE